MPVAAREVTPKQAKKGPKGRKPPSSSNKLPPLAVKSLLFLGYIIGLSATYPVIKSPVLPHPLRAKYRSRTYPVEILSAVQSVTGLIVVGQALPQRPDSDGNWPSQIVSARYLRAAHSILGGVWTDNLVRVLDDKPPLIDSQGEPLGDSIYGVFVVQEAVRMVNSAKLNKSDSEKHALVTGLGAGISTTSLMRHGIKTDIIEIDPAVYDAARMWFALPDPAKLGGQVFLQDARSWVNTAKTNQTREYDIVIHDCFSGGGVPQHLYSVEFFEDLKLILQLDGVLVVNFVGKVDSDSSRMVLSTLEKVIGPCRAFHDLMDKLPVEKYGIEFHNIIFFCASEAVTFRESDSVDWLGSPLRRHVLSDMKKREIDLSVIRDFGTDEYLVSDASNTLNKLQEKLAGFHWKLMRDVLEHFYWEIY